MGAPAYASIDDLLDRFSRSDLAERGAPDDHDVTGDILRGWIDGLRGESLAPDAADVAAVEASAKRAVDRIGAALGAACARVFGYVGARYPEAPDDAEDLLKSLAVDIFAGDFFGGEDRRAARAEALRMLASVAEGRHDLPGAAGDASVTSDAVRAAAPDETFTKSALDGYV